MEAPVNALSAVGGVRIFLDPRVPLTRTNDVGAQENALCWTAPDGLGGRCILVHPERWDAFQSSLAEMK